MSHKKIRVSAGVSLLAVSGLLFAQEAREGPRWPGGKRVAVSLSFDDARASQVDVGLPIFDRHGVKATFYVSPRSIEKRLEGWKKAAAAGHEIGNHSNTHPCSGNFAFARKNALEEYTLARMEKDLDAGSAEVERLLGVKPLTFAFPCGQKFVGVGLEASSYVPLVARRFLVGRGFRDEGSNDPAIVDLAQVMGMEMDGLTFEQMKDLVSGAAQQGRWLVFAGHEIGKPGRQTTLADALDRFLAYAKDPANGIWIDTVAAVGKHVKAQRGGK